MCYCLTLSVLSCPKFVYIWYRATVYPENTNLRVSMTVQMTSCLFYVDSAVLLMLNEHLVKSKLVKQEVSHTVILPPIVCSLVYPSGSTPS